MTRPSTATDAPPQVGHSVNWVLLDGSVLPYDDVHIPAWTHAFHYGTGCFEGIRAYWNEQVRQLYLLQARPHLERLLRSARIMRIDLPYTVEQLIGMTIDLLRRNDHRGDAYVRPLAYKRAEQMEVTLAGLPSSLLVLTAAVGSYIDVDRGIRCMVSSWRRLSDSAIPARAKITGSYVNSALAKSEAVENGFDEAIMLTEEGHVSEGSAENIFMFRDGVFVTPPVTDDILEGITRSLLLDLIRDELGVPVLERSIDRTELYVCDELFLCGTGAQISPVVEVDRRPIGGGGIGELTRRLQETYFSAVRGRDERYADWLVPVY
jgi:branched-chain amino acid aminotransferase